MKRMIRAVFADIDGTLYSHTADRIPESAMDAVRKIREKGVLVFAATGRHMLEINDLNMNIELDGWITMNGALCFDDHGIWHSDPIRKEDLSVLIKALRTDPFPCQFMEKDLMYINMYDERVKASLDAIHTAYPQILDPKRALEHDTYLITPWVRQEIWSKVHAKTEYLKYTRWTDLASDAMSASAGKKNGVLAACAHYAIDPKQTLAIGDGPNDIELFEACAYSAAMGNSSIEVKKAAGYTGEDIDSDGFAKILAEFIG